MSSTIDIRLKGELGPRLLLELEPAHRIFFRNLADTVLSRRMPPVATTSKPGRFWEDVFVYTGLPWSAFLESVLWHMAVISVLFTLTQAWMSHQSQMERKLSQDSVLYYMPSKSFPAFRSSAPHTQPKAQSKPAHPSPIRVAPERAHGALKPPDIKVARGGKPDIIGANPSRPVTPLFAPRLSELTVPAGPASVVAPASNVRQVTAHRYSLPPSSIIAPAPQIGSVSARSALSAPHVSVVAPTPSLQVSAANLPGLGTVRSQVIEPPPQIGARERDIARRMDAALGSANLVVPPAPSDKSSRAFGRERLISGSIALVVPPAPAVQDGGNSAGARRMSALSGGGVRVVPPTPVIRGGGNSAVRRMGLTGASAQVVPPVPTVQGGGYAEGRRRAALAGLQGVPPVPTVQGGGNAVGARRMSGLSGAGVHVVPPTAAVRGGGNSAGRQMKLSGTGVPVVPPAPGMGDGGTDEARRMAPLSDAGEQVAPPAPASEDAENSGSDRPMAMNSTPAAAPAENAKLSDPATIELPVRVIGLAVALPNSSYFSNYEVFIAERRISKDQSELIKLVYISLPYQKRLSEYGFDNAKVYKLRVKRDKTCDETLLQMTWPETNQNHSGSRYATGPPSLGPNDSNNLLPCYRTTADDYQKALSGTH